MRATLQDLLSTGKPITADGAMGTMLFALGLQQGDSPELWNVEQPDKVRSVHRAYVEAGAQIILTNTFGGSRIRLARHDLADRAAELNRAAAQLARAEADAAGHAVVVAGSMGPTGVLLEPLGDLPFDEAAAAFGEQARALIDGGIDVLWIETMADLEEVRAAVEGVRRAAPGFPVVTTMTFDTGGRTMMGVTPEKAVEVLGGFGALAVGGNCGTGPEELQAVISRMRIVAPDTVLIAKANAGLPHMEGDKTVYDARPEDMADYAVKAHGLGAQIVGACCGSGPAHIQAIAQALAAQRPV